MTQQRIALVTGGLGAIGTAICQKLASDGYRVVAAYNSGGRSKNALAWVEEQRELGFTMHVARADIRDYPSCQRLAEAIRTEHGPVSVLVNCAGITSDARLQKMSLENWTSVIDTNLSGVFNITRNILDDMLGLNYGRIINISSINASKGQFGQTNYAAAKAGMHGFTKALAQEVALKGITVNTISPGYIETAMLESVPAAIREQILKQIPVGRFGRPEEVARVVSFLAAEESSFITGANFSINGGHHMY